MDIMIQCNNKDARRLATLAGLAVSLNLAGTTLASDYNTKVVATGLDRPAGIVAVGPRALVITQLPTPGVPGTEGGKNTVDFIRLGPTPVKNRMVNLTTGEPEPTNLALGRHGSLYWTCKSAGVILERSREGTVSLSSAGSISPVASRWTAGRTCISPKSPPLVSPALMAD